VPMVMPYSLILNLIVGFYGNALYHRQAEKKIAVAKASYPPDLWLMGLSRLGGVSWLALLLIPVFTVLENLIIAVYQNDFVLDKLTTIQGIQL
jgi:hypothetical protein